MANARGVDTIRIVFVVETNPHSLTVPRCQR